MLISEGSEAVIGTYEEIVAGDACRVVEWRLMRLYVVGQDTPQALTIFRQRLPGCNGPAMNGQYGLLPLCAGIRTLRPLPEQPPAVPMIGRKISGRSVEVGKKDGGKNGVHSGYKSFAQRWLGRISEVLQMYEISVS